MILELIRKETKESHQNLEKLIIPRIKNVHNLHDYVELLRIFYGYFRPVEGLIDRFMSDDNMPHYSTRRKSDALLSDIEKANESIPTLRVAETLPLIKNACDAIGAMYVLEGSTLGGKVISKMLQQNLQLESTDTLKFFSGYGGQSELYWSSFTKTLDEFTSDPEEQKAIVASAVETFRLFGTWINEYSPEA